MVEFTRFLGKNGQIYEKITTETHIKYIYSENIAFVASNEISLSSIERRQKA